MERSEDSLFQQFISDTGFIRWAKGEQVPDAGRWDNWKSEHPEDASKFDEAVKLVQSFSFSTPEISDQEIRYLRNTLFSGIERRTGNPKARKLYDTLIKIAAVLFIPLLIYTVWVHVDKAYLESGYARVAGDRNKQNISVVAPIGTRTVVDLPDGSKAWLNAGSQLTYPALFSKKERRIEITGEAFFKVQEDDVPFIVQNPGPEIKVYGTSFSINSYPDEELVTVALVEGKISLLINGKEHFLNPGQVSYFNKSQQSVSVQNENIDRFICWREGKFIFRDTPLSSILRQLQRQYNVEIHLTQPGLGSYRYIATFQNENLDQILELLSLSAPIRYKYERGTLNNDGAYLKGKVTIYEDKERIVQY
jgi:ferric-dicitrate binding protein FerR (iron transport regulator)